MEIEFAAVGMTGQIGSLNLNLTLGIAARLGLAPSVCTCTQNFEIDSIRTLVLFVIASFLLKSFVLRIRLRRKVLEHAEVY